MKAQSSPREEKRARRELRRQMEDEAVLDAASATVERAAAAKESEVAEAEQAILDASDPFAQFKAEQGSKPKPKKHKGPKE